MCINDTCKRNADEISVKKQCQSNQRRQKKTDTIFVVPHNYRDHIILNYVNYTHGSKSPTDTYFKNRTNCQNQLQNRMRYLTKAILISKK